MQYLLEEILQHMDDRDYSFLKDILPWSEKLPEGICKAKILVAVKQLPKNVKVFAIWCLLYIIKYFVVQLV